MEKEFISELRRDIRRLVLQEIRLLRLRQIFSPDIIIDEISRSIEDTKAKIVRLTRYISFKKRERLLHQMLMDAIDEEIDKTIRFRSNRCLRCINVRFYDDSESSYEILPSANDLIKTIGCNYHSLSSELRCERFVEISSSNLESYLNDMSLLYEFREFIEQLEEIWQKYFLR